MDYIDYRPLGSNLNFPADATASPSNPKTLFVTQSGLTYLNIGAGWVLLCQTNSRSIYAGYSGANAAGQAAVIVNLTTSSSLHSARGAEAANLLQRGK